MCKCGVNSTTNLTIQDLEKIKQKGISFNDIEPDIDDELSIFAFLCTTENEELIQFCIDNGANIDLIQNNGTPLIWAVQQEEDNVARLLIKNGANVNLAVDGFTPIMSSLYARNRNCFNYLLESGADIHLSLPDNSNILHLACGDGRWDFIDPLLELNIACVKNNSQHYPWNYMPNFGTSYIKKMQALAKQQGHF